MATSELLITAVYTTALLILWKGFGKDFGHKIKRPPSEGLL